MACGKVSADQRVRCSYSLQAYSQPYIACSVPPVMTITDIAGLVRGASEGAGLGNAFLSHIQAVDAIYHMVRAFDSTEITHVEGMSNKFKFEYA